MSESNKPQSTVDGIYNNVRLVLNADAIQKFFLIDTIIGFILIISILVLLFDMPWISLGNLQLVSGGTYNDLLEEQADVLREIYAYNSKTLEHLNTINLDFSLTEMVSMSSNSWDSPADAIFRSQDEYIAAVQDAGYKIPVVEFPLVGDEIWLQFSAFGFIAITIMGFGMLFASRPFGFNYDYTPIVFIALRIGRRGMYGLILLSLFLMMLGRMVWLFLYLVPSAEAILSNQNILVQPYTLNDILAWGFFAELIIVCLLNFLCIYGYLRKRSEQNLEKAKN